VRCTAGWTAGRDIRLSAELSSPATFASTILLPEGAADWTESTRAAVLAHEGAHVHNRDFLVLAVAGIYRAVFWFNPLAWWLPRRLALLAEHASDDAAVAAIGDRAAYASLLLGFAQRMPRARGVLAMAQALIGCRIERILDMHAAERTPKTLAWTTSAAALLLATAAVAVVQFEGQSAPSSDPLLPLTHPAYPAAAQRLGEHGTVILNLYVRRDGSVADVRVHKSSGFARLDDSAAAEAGRWRLAPSTLNGESVAAWGRFAVTFKLAD
jgi:TonB family protein